MHLLATLPGIVSDGTEPVDPDQSPADVIFRRKIQSGGPKYIDFTFEVARDATDFESEERVIEVHTITVMQLVPADQLGF